MKEIIAKLTALKKTISTMESCTGGAVASRITDYEGSSEVLKFSAVTYSNEFKIKMGVEKEIIDEFSVYSGETAVAMATHIAEFASADFGIGITGKLNYIDKNNLYGENNVVFISIYDKSNNKYYNSKIVVNNVPRKENKELVIEKIIEELKNILSINE